MSPKPSVVGRLRSEDDWDQFRPARDLKLAPPKRPRQGLVLATVLVFAVMVAFRFRPEVETAVAHVARAVLDSRQPAWVITRTKVVERRSIDSHGKRRIFRPEPRSGGAAALGPFDAYVLDGDRYIRIEGMSTYALLDTRTGKVIWIRQPR